MNVSSRSARPNAIEPHLSITRRCIVWSLALIAGLGAAEAAERVLLVDGRSDYEIVCAADANAASTFAARELRTWIQASSGVDLPISAQPSPTMKHFFVGPNEWSARAGITPEGLKAEGYRWRTIGDDVHIVGADVLRGSLAPKRVSGTQTGSLSGVYDWLERFLGVQFLWHDELGTIVPKQSRVVVPDLDVETAPAWTYRFLAYSPEGKCGDDLFARRLRLGHSYTVTHSHSWHQIAPVDKYGKEHPEWFAEIAGERRPAYYMQNHGGQVCTTNAEVIELFAKAAIDFFHEHPDRDMFSVSPNDGGGFCTCAKCRALDNGQRPDWHPILTDRLLTFYNAIAERVAQAHPTKLLGAYAYSFYREPPTNVKPHANLYLVHTTNSAFHQGAGWPDEHETEKRWRAVAQHLAKYDIYYSPDSSLNLLAPVTRHLVEKLRAESRIGLEGGYLYMGQSYEQLGVGHLLMARLMWNPDADVEALATGYYRALYGAAAPQVQAYYELLESRLSQARSAPLDTGIAALRVALRKHPGLGSPAYLLSAYEPVLEAAATHIATAQACDLTKDERSRLQRLADQHTLLETTVRGMFVAARLETDARSNAGDAKALLDLIERRQAVRARLQSYAPSLCASLEAGDRAETEALAPGGPIAQLARALLAPRDAATSMRNFPHGDIEKVSPAQLPERYRWSAIGAATLDLETTAPRNGKQSLRIQVPKDSTAAITFAIEVKPATAYRLTVDHWNDPAPAAAASTDDADAITRGEPPIAPRTRVIFRDAKGKAVARNHWSGIAAHEWVKTWHTQPHLLQTPDGTRSVSFTIFLQHPGTYLIDNVQIEELGGIAAGQGAAHDVEWRDGVIHVAGKSGQGRRLSSR